MTAGRTETTWRKTAEKKGTWLGGGTGMQPKAAAQNRQRWIESVPALFAYWGDEKR